MSRPFISVLLLSFPWLCYHGLLLKQAKPQPCAKMRQHRRVISSDRAPLVHSKYDPVPSLISNKSIWRSNVKACRGRLDTTNRGETPSCNCFPDASTAGTKCAGINGELSEYLTPYSLWSKRVASCCPSNDSKRDEEDIKTNNVMRAPIV